MTDSRGGISEDEALDLEAAEAFISERDWSAAEPVVRRLAAGNRAEPRYRALLAFVLGYAAEQAGDLTRARVEWERAISLDPSLERRGIRRRRTSFVQRLFRS